MSEHFGPTRWASCWHFSQKHAKLLLSKHQINLKFIYIALHACLITSSSFKLHCLKQLPSFFSFNAAVVLEAFEELISFTFARLFKFHYSVPKANYHIDSANPTAHWPSFNSGTQQKHFPKSMSLIAASPLSPRWFKTHWGEGWSGAWQATLPTLVLFAPARCSPSVLQRVHVSLC